MKLDRRSFLSTLGLTSLMGMNGNFARGADEDPRDVRIAHCCDPQLGFSADGYEATRDRLFKMVDIINEIKPDVVAFVGDMMHESEDSPQDMVTALKKIGSPVMIAPGNHDIPEPVTLEKLERYRSVYGPDRLSMEISGWKLIAINTQLWRESPPSETADQEKWLFAELNEAEGKGRPVIILSHIPPFYANPNESDEWGVIPDAHGKRSELLDRCLKSGVKFWLAGHTHMTQLKAYNGMMILNGETTSNNFDKRPFGFRLLTIKPDGNHTWDFVPINS